MAHTPPNVLFPNMTADNSALTIPYIDLPGLSGVGANPQFGDARAIAKALIERIFVAFSELPTDDRPLGFSVSKSNPLGSGLDQVSQNYSLSLTYTYEASGVTLLPEPDAPQLASSSSGSGIAA